MNVTCGRCGTEYDFDDALVSERGTTVRCTRCAFEFRVRPPRQAERQLERWIVRKTTGEEYDFVALRDLQQAIAQRRVSDRDEFSRDGLSFRPLAEVAELEAFFEPAPTGTRAGMWGRRTKGAAEAPAPATPSSPRAPTHATLPTSNTGIDSTIPGISPAMVVEQKLPSPVNETARVPSVTVRGADTSYQHLPFANEPDDEEVTRAYRAVDWLALAGEEPESQPSQPLPGPPQVPPPPPRVAPVAHPVGHHTATGSSPQAATSPASSPFGSSPLGSSPKASSPLGSNPLASNPLGSEPDWQAPLPRRGRVQYASSPSHAMTPSPVPRGRLIDGQLAPFPASIPPPSRGSSGPRWIAALILVGGLALLASTAGRSYLKQFTTQTAASSFKDTRSQELVARGAEYLRAGDLEAAKAEYDKASALAENDPDVLSGLLQVELRHADTLWLRLRLASGQADSARAALQAEFDARMPKLKTAADNLRRNVTARPAAALLIADSMRISGDLPEARQLIGATSEVSAEPDSAYVLSMLDAADSHPSWPAVIARLTDAAHTERGLGRANVALIYALGTSGDSAEATRQMNALAAPQAPDVMYAALRAYVAGLAPAATDSNASAGVSSKLPSGKAEPEGEPRVEHAALDTAGDGDALTQAALAERAGDWTRAGRLYTAALSSNPGNGVAMIGLGDVARAQGRLAVAASHYSAALRQEPDSIGALRGLADVRWMSGEKAAAVQLYRRLPAGQQTGSVAQRIAEQAPGAATGAGAAPQDSVPSAASVTGGETIRPVSPAAASDKASEVDTSDLPEYN